MSIVRRTFPLRFAGRRSTVVHAARLTYDGELPEAITACGRTLGNHANQLNGDAVTCRGCRKAGLFA